MATADVEGEKQPVPQLSLSPSDKFFRYFQHEVTGNAVHSSSNLRHNLTLPDLQHEMTRIQNHGTSGGERADAVDHCLSAIARLSTEVQDASAYIPAYDQRTYGDAIKGLNAKLQEVRTSVAPKPKFSFKSGALFSAKKNESAISINDAAELASQRRHQMMQGGSSNVSSFATTPIEVTSPAELTGDASHSIDGASSTSTAAINLKNRENEHVTLPSVTTHETSSGTVADIKHSVVNISAPSRSTPFAGLTLKNISHSLIICGHVSGAVHLTNIRDSVVVLASRQFRMHDSSNCDIYLLAASRPIIEDCAGVRFAPLPETFMGESDGKVENMWEKVDDFKWLRNEQSPNWSILPAEKRLTEETWQRVVSEEEAWVGVEEILNAVGLGVES